MILKVNTLLSEKVIEGLINQGVPRTSIAHTSVNSLRDKSLSSRAGKLIEQGCVIICYINTRPAFVLKPKILYNGKK